MKNFIIISRIIGAFLGLFLLAFIFYRIIFYYKYGQPLAFGHLPINASLIMRTYEKTLVELSLLNSIIIFPLFFICCVVILINKFRKKKKFISSDFINFLIIIMYLIYFFNINGEFWLL